MPSTAPLRGVSVRVNIAGTGPCVVPGTCRTSVPSGAPRSAQGRGRKGQKVASGTTAACGRVHLLAAVPVGNSSTGLSCRAPEPHASTRFAHGFSLERQGLIAGWEDSAPQSGVSIEELGATQPSCSVSRVCGACHNGIQWQSLSLTVAALWWDACSCEEACLSGSCGSQRGTLLKLTHCML